MDLPQKQDLGITFQKIGSVISQISQVNVKTADEAKKIFDDASKKGLESVLLQVFQNDFSRFLILKIK